MQITNAPGKWPGLHKISLFRQWGGGSTTHNWLAHSATRHLCSARNREFTEHCFLLPGTLQGAVLACLRRTNDRLRLVVRQFSGKKLLVVKMLQIASGRLQIRPVVSGFLLQGSKWRMRMRRAFSNLKREVISTLFPLSCRLVVFVEDVFWKLSS